MTSDDRATQLTVHVLRRLVGRVKANRRARSRAFWRRYAEQEQKNV